VVCLAHRRGGEYTGRSVVPCIAVAVKGGGGNVRGTLGGPFVRYVRTEPYG
jgi:hypothetical protein